MMNIGSETYPGYKQDIKDFDRFVDASVGFPYDIPFIFRLRSTKHKFWEGHVPFFKSGRSYLKWISWKYK